MSTPAPGDPYEAGRAACRDWWRSGPRFIFNQTEGGVKWKRSFVKDVTQSISLMETFMNALNVLRSIVTTAAQVTALAAVAESSWLLAGDYRGEGNEHQHP